MAFQPKDAADSCLERSNKFLTAATENLPDPEIKDDLRRTAVVMSVAALDSYMHWLIIQRISSLRKEGDIPNSLKKYKMPFSSLANVADNTISKRKNNKDARPWVQIKNYLQKQILTETFQSFDQVSNAFSMAGIKGPWKEIADKMETTPEKIKARLNSIVHRRNQIAHEGDIARSSRPRDVKYNDIDHKKIEADVQWMDTLINAIEAVRV